MEEKINQILRNQRNIMIKLSDGRYYEGYFACRIEETEELLNPTKQPSIAERTHDAFSKKNKQ